jgi:hypothetical protein
MKAIVDCNNFYCSCERLFKPHLDRKPVVVLSNNDGCIVSRSDEAKKLGVEMAGPYFMAKPLIEKHNVFVVAKGENHNVDFRGATHSDYITLPTATSFTNELIKPAVALVDKLYQKGTFYKKAGVMLSGIVPDMSIQGNLFVSENKNCERKLMDMIDNINFSQRDDVLKFAASATTRDWKMRQELRSPRYTTRWDELYEVR